MDVQISFLLKKISKGIFLLITAAPVTKLKLSHMKFKRCFLMLQSQAIKIMTSVKLFWRCTTQDQLKNSNN